MVLGGYGFFGERISASLASDSSVRLLVAGRDGAKAAALVARLGLPPDQAVVLDANDPALSARLQELRVNTLIHTAGPFQAQKYTVAMAAITAGCH